MILEGLVTTTDPNGRPHLAPMGPRVEGPDFATFVLRPFPSSRTYQNLCLHPEGVLHVTDDALLLARAVIGRPDPFPPVRLAARVAGFILEDCCRYREFRVAAIDTKEPRVVMAAEVVASGLGRRSWFGFNRARHAVVEAAILASRAHILPRERIDAEFNALTTIVAKTGGPDEQTAMELLRAHVAAMGERA
jgi:hypothetical protein